METGNEIKLTQYSRGAGCGCKIAPAVLQEILKDSGDKVNDPRLLVGYETGDDAAVYDLGNGSALISTTDFFMPIVDDAYDFGRIAAANAISDVYAMGGKPIMAIAVLGWPIEKIPAAVASKVLEGARVVCRSAGIILAGGHSVDAAEPMFGLSVTGTVDISNLKKNNTAKEGDILFLTKPIGTGILSTAQKRAAISDDHLRELVSSMTTLNDIGGELGSIKEVHAMTDVTGFGLAGHLIEMMEGCGCSAEINYASVPVMQGVREYLAQRIVPDATYRNWNSYGQNVGFEKGVNVMEAFSLLPDPQTNGGLLISVSKEYANEISSLLESKGLYSIPVGRVVERKDKLISVLN